MTSVTMGGQFGEGARLGAISAGIGLLSNQLAHSGELDLIIDKLINVARVGVTSLVSFLPAGRLIKGSVLVGALGVAVIFSDRTADERLGVPHKEYGYKPPRNWNGEKVKNPNGAGSGYPAKNGDVWVPTDHKGTHAPHWDVQHPDGNYTDVYPKEET